MKKISMVILLALIPGMSFAGIEMMTPKRVYDLIGQGSGLWMIDVRSNASYSRGYIEGAINIPLSELSGKILPKNKVIVFVDNSLGQTKAKQAATSINHKGASVFIMKDGVRGWQRSGLPLVGSADLYSLAQVSPTELFSAQRSGQSIKLVDLRTESEQKKAPLSGAEVIGDGSFDDQLTLVLSQLRQPQKGVRSLLSSVPVVLVLPATVSAHDVYLSKLWDLSRDVRVLEGGYLARANGEKKIVSSGECMTCPGN